jgi:hypothetical protein
LPGRGVSAPPYLTRRRRRHNQKNLEPILNNK